MLRKTTPVILAGALLAVAALAAQDDGGAAGDPASAWDAFAQKANAYLQKKDKELSGFDLRIKAGFIQHAAGDTSFIKFDLGASLAEDSYPHQLRFDTGASFVLQDDAYRENVSTLRLNYDRYLAPWLEAFSFVERFTDSYLGIQQRFEIGAGLKLEGRLSPDRDRWEEERRGLAAAVDDQLLAWRSRPEAAADPSLRRRIRAMERERDRIRNFILRALQKVEVSLSLNVFSEIEQAALETYVDRLIAGTDGMATEPASATSKITLDGEHRLRYVIRPSFAFKPSDALTVRGQFYWKGPLGSPARRDGRLDYRFDTLLGFELGLPVAASWAKSLYLKLEHKIHYDNCPPRIPASIRAEYLAKGQVFRSTEARSKHQEFSLSLELEL
jgi:hypothetical protein